MPDQTVIDNTNTNTPEVVEEAKLYGWVEKDKFRGDQKDWVDAAEYVKRGRNSIPILRTKLANSEAQLRTLKDTVGTLQKDMETVRQVGYDQAAKEWQAKLDALKAQKVTALEDDDATKVVQLDDAIAEHKDKKPAAPKKTDDTFQLPADQQAWMQQNDWYGKDKKLTAKANVLAVDFASDGLQGVALFEAVKAELTAMFPEEMGAAGGDTTTSSQPRTHRSGTRTGHRNGEGKGGGRTYSDLPKEAQEACDRLVKAKRLTQDEYVANFKGWN